MNTGIMGKIYCTEKAIWKYTSNKIIEPPNTCTGYIDQTKMYERIVSQCQGLKTCKISIKDWYVKSAPQFVKDGKSPSNICDNEAMMFL
jgi:hypothetical protein